MTAFEITLICIFGFISLLLTIQVCVVVCALLKSRSLMQDIQRKLQAYDAVFHTMRRSAKSLEQETEELYESNHDSLNRLLDLAAHLTSFVTMGAGMWKHYRRRKR